MKDFASPLARRVVRALTLVTLGKKVHDSETPARAIDHDARVQGELERLRVELSNARANYDLLQDKVQGNIAEFLRGAISSANDIATLGQALDSQVLMLPSPELQKRVVGVAAPDFLASGKETLENLVYLLSRIGKRIQDFESILDYGCGAGRSSRFFMLYGAKRLPTCVDVDPDQIAYCQSTLSRLGRFERIPEYPPTALAHESFDLVFSVSTFTHFREDMQHAWLAELRRVTRLGGILVLSIHGRNSAHTIPPERVAEYQRTGFLFVKGAARSAHNPEYYHLAFHSHDYVRRVWAEYFEIVDIVDRVINQNHDAVICMRSS
jgi:SAM-dependent methyltransferase